MKIIITGKTGLIGSAIFNNLINNNHQIISIGRNNCDYYVDLNNLNIDISNISGDVFIHCAGVTDEEIKSNREQAISRNTIGLINLVDYAKEIGILKFIYFSSAHVYGNLNRKINEESTTEPKSLYGVLHLFAEKYIKSVFNNVFILRPCAVFGNISDRFNRWELIPFSFPRDLALKKEIVILTHGKQSRNFISTTTLASITKKEIKTEGSKTINPLGYYSMSLVDFANYCVDSLEDNSEILYSIKVKNKSKYNNNFYFNTIHNCEKENPILLKKHILNIFSSFQE